MKLIYLVLTYSLKLKKYMSIHRVIHVLFQASISKPQYIRYKYNGHDLYINNDDTALFHIVNSTKKIETLVNNINMQSVDTVFDIGANCGLFAYFIKKKFPESTVYCFEPIEELIECIKKNINTFSNVHIVQKAMCDTSGLDIKFYQNPEGQQTNSILLNSVTDYCKESKINSISIKSETLDNFCAKHDINSIDVLKVDIQGAEYKMLQGAKNTLNKVTLAFFEITFLDNDIVETLSLLKSYLKNYKVINEVKMGADVMFYN